MVATKTLRLDGRCMTTREEAHSHLAARLGFPAYYGRNLDALYDCLAELSGVRIELENVDALSELGGYGDLLLGTLEEAAEDNPSLEFALV